MPIFALFSSLSFPFKGVFDEEMGDGDSPIGEARNSVDFILSTNRELRCGTSTASFIVKARPV